VSLFGDRGPRSTALRAYLRRRSRAPARLRPELDCKSFPELFRRRAVVFTDTADFTVRTAQDGILHFLMLFERLLPGAEAAVRRQRGRVVKVEGDSLLLAFPDAVAACRGVRGLARALASYNRARPENERLHFSYGIGCGDVLEVEHDLFGLEVNLASKLGEDLARPGEALLTPAAVAALDSRTRKELVAYRVVSFGKTTIDVRRLAL
jgi:class 3 adenylate cyclase